MSEIFILFLSPEKIIFMSKFIFPQDLNSGKIINNWERWIPNLNSLIENLIEIKLLTNISRVEKFELFTKEKLKFILSTNSISRINGSKKELIEKVSLLDSSLTDKYINDINYLKLTNRGSELVNDFNEFMKLNNPTKEQEFEKNWEEFIVKASKPEDKFSIVYFKSDKIHGDSRKRIYKTTKEFSKSALSGVVGNAIYDLLKISLGGVIYYLYKVNEKEDTEIGSINSIDSLSNNPSAFKLKDSSSEITLEDVDKKLKQEEIDIKEEPQKNNDATFLETTIPISINLLNTISKHMFNPEKKIDYNEIEIHNIMKFVIIGLLMQALGEKDKIPYEVWVTNWYKEDVIYFDLENSFDFDSFKELEEMRIKLSHSQLDFYSSLLYHVFHISSRKRY